MGKPTELEKLDNILCRFATGYNRIELLTYSVDDTGLDYQEVEEELKHVDKYKQAILDWHNKELLAVLERLEGQKETCYDCIHGNSEGENVEFIPLSAIKQEKEKIK